MSRAAKPAPRMNCSMDDHRSPEGRQLIGEMRGGMLAAAEANPLPDRFSAVPHPDRPAMIVCDEVTGKSCTVGMFAYGAVRQALTDLFATEPTLTDVAWEADEAAGTLTITPIYAGVDETRGIGMVLRYGRDTKLGQRLVAAIKAGATHAPTGVGTNIYGRTYAKTAVNVMGRTLNADLRRLGF